MKGGHEFECQGDSVWQQPGWEQPVYPQHNFWEVETTLIILPSEFCTAPVSILNAQWMNWAFVCIVSVVENKSATF